MQHVKQIKLLQIHKTVHQVQYQYEVSESLAHYFTDKPFVIDYPENIESVPDAILAIPFVANVLPIVWLENAELTLAELDEDFYNSIPEFKKGYAEMYPDAEFRGQVTVGRLESLQKENQDGALVFFSGGVDATTTLFRHIEENPILVTLWGADISFENTAAWNAMYPLLEAGAKNYNMDICYIHTTFRDFDREDRLGVAFYPVLGKYWWYGVKHGIGIISHVAPLVWLHGIKNVYFASSNCPEDGNAVKCASDPKIDNRVRFCGCRVIHDGFELNRQKKIHYITEYHRNHAERPINLHVCWQSDTGKNCCRCEKCYRTMAGLWAEGEDPKDYGFNYPPDVFKEMYCFMALECRNMAHKTWTYCKNRLIENWANLENEDYAKKIEWIKDYDFIDIDRNPCRQKADKLKKMRRHLRAITNPKSMAWKIFPDTMRRLSLFKNKFER